MSFNKHKAGRSKYSYLRKEESERIKCRLQRDWDRLPELRAQHGNSYKRYLVSMRHNVIFS